jgi:uncharacterized protein YoxC
MSLRRILGLSLALAAAGCNAELERKNQELQKRLDSLEATVQSLDSATSVLQSHVEEQTTSLATLQETVAHHGDTLGSLQSSVSSHTEKLSDLSAKVRMQNDESLFVWDGGGRYLGKLFTFGNAPGPFVYVDPNGGLLVQAVVVPGNPLFFTSPDCTGRVFARSPMLPPQLPVGAILDQTTGEVFRHLGFEVQPVMVLSHRDPAGTGGCIAEEGVASGEEWESAYALEPFTRRPYVAQAKW